MDKRERVNPAMCNQFDGKLAGLTRRNMTETLALRLITVPLVIRLYDYKVVQQSTEEYPSLSRSRRSVHDAVAQRGEIGKEVGPRPHAATLSTRISLLKSAVKQIYRPWPWCYKLNLHFDIRLDKNVTSLTRGASQLNSVAPAEVTQKIRTGTKFPSYVT